MESKEGEHTVIICDKCKHRIRYHEKGQFACIVPGCNCTKIEPVEKIFKIGEQEDIIKIKEDGTVIS